jgi:phosphohistidine phosphatase
MRSMASMQVYFVRHGDAGEKRKWKGPDAERPLSKRGLKTCRQAAEHFACILPAPPGIVLTSPLVRAAQTASIVARAWDVVDTVTADSRLDHGFSVARLRGILSDYRGHGTIVLVGHEPSMSGVISGLVGGGAIELKKGGVASVLVTNRTKPKGKLQFLVTPAVLDCE